MGKQIKKFVKTEKGMTITVTNGDVILLPTEDGQKPIGDYEQTTLQYIDEDKIQTLRDFVQLSYDRAKGQKDLLDKKLATFKDVDEKQLDVKLVKAIQDQIGKGTKVFKQKMLALNGYISNIANKVQVIQQLEYMNKEVDTLSGELNDLDEAIK